MLKPQRTSVYLARPFSFFEYNRSQNVLKFLIAKHGQGTKEMSMLQDGEKVILTGPLGNHWSSFLPDRGMAALVGGSVGIAPLAALVAEKPGYNFNFFAGLRNGFNTKEEENSFLGAAVNSSKVILTAEDGRNAMQGKITDFIYEPDIYNVIFGCGPMPMLKVLKKKCESKNIPCFLSLESRMACGVGACLGCTVKTKKGNMRCCTEGPIFYSEEVLFDE
jgi:NAD(P)H-flavin reductase